MKWTHIQKSEVSGTPILYSKTLLSVFGFRADIHKIVQADPLDRYHSHPATAIRIILKGGYVEELYDPKGGIVVCARWSPGCVGVVTPSYTHRIHRLIKGPSWSLWLRGPTTHQTFLRGNGWPTFLRNKGV